MRGPVTSALTRISSAWKTKGCSSLVIDDHHGTKRFVDDDAGVVVTDDLVAISYRPCLIERSAPRLAVANDARCTEFEAVGMSMIHLDQVHPLVGVTGADLIPGQ